MGGPKHIAIIMDGNGRWASARNLPRWEGHKKGAQRVRPIVEACKSRGVKALTIFAFSEQNWGRPEKEIALLMELLARFVAEEKPHLMEEGIRVVTLGDLDRLPPSARAAIDELVSETAENESFTLAIALSYGGREEIIRATKAVAQQIEAGELSPDELTASHLSAKLDTATIPWELDLLIRTSGEHRLSNFLLWQCAYAEFYFSDVLWPDFAPADLHNAIDSFIQRERRFGLVHEELSVDEGAGEQS